MSSFWSFSLFTLSKECNIQYRFLSLICLIACFVLGCAGGKAKRNFLPLSVKSHILLQLPFFPENTDQCGPSALASVLRFWGDKTDPDQLKKEIYRSKLRGSLSIDLLLAAQNHGLSAEIINDGLPRLKKELDLAHPLIVFVNLGYRFIPIGHYMVVTGYDDGDQVIYVDSGTQKNEAISYADFLKEWRKTDQWTLLILPIVGK